ncbi:MAG: sorbosone dehydrogenase family protein [Mucilaginibacter polytrichastri]|nr:sorbosone dehydrogenase family protein [Mucilaginibacter polytrichastri]
MYLKTCIYFAFLGLAAAGCSSPGKKEISDSAAVAADTVRTPDAKKVELPAPFATKSANNNPHVKGWDEGKMPVAPDGFTVTRFAGGLDNPRWLYQLPNGDILVAETATRGSKANRITLFRDADKDGKFEKRELFMNNLNQPLGMLLLNGKFYVAVTDGLLQFPYKEGTTSIDVKSGKKILELPAGGYNNHWTRNLLAAKDGSKIYVSVGSGSNVAEHGLDNEKRRANILQVNPDGSGEKIYASGLRNPVGMAWAPGTNTLWTAVNERDELGDDLVPDYITSVKEGGFYGWPYSYYGQHEDPRMKDKQNPELVKKAIVPDVPMGAHTASLGLAFYEKGSFPEKYKGGAFVGQHGSWNRAQPAGYKVVFVPFKNGKPAGDPEDFLTGFMADPAKNDVYGRPVGVLALADGSLLVADDAGNTLWQISAKN